MPDREKVIGELETLTMCGRYDALVVCVAREAIALLREQSEPVKPIKEPLAGSGYAIWQCGNCKAWLRITDRFCGRCGKKVKRDG